MKDPPTKDPSTGTNQELLDENGCLKRGIHEPEQAGPTYRPVEMEELRLNEARLESLLKISQHKTESIQELLDFALAEAITLTGSKIGYIYFYDDRKQEFTLNTWSRGVMKACAIAEPRTIYQLEKTGIWGEAVRQAKPIAVNDFQAPHPLKRGYPEGHAPLCKYLTVPVFSAGRIVAVAAVANKQTDYDESDVRQLTLMMDSVWKIADLRRTEEELRRGNRTLRIKSDANHALIHARDETTLLNEVCRIIVEAGGYRLLWIGIAEQDEAKSVRPVAHAGFEDGYLESAHITWADRDRGRGPIGTAIRTGRPCVVRDTLSDPAFAPWRAEAVRRGFKSVIALPLIGEGRTLGALNIYAGEADAFDAQEVEILKELADDLAFGIATLRSRAKRELAEEQLRRSLDNLRKAFGATVQVLVSAVEARDPYTAGHQNRSADLARAIAAEMGLPKESIDGIRMAGIIHDIGKLSVPAEILSKPTKLTELEFSLIKEHAEKGFEMLKDVESPWPLAEIVHQHHERIDGSGYPRHLKGEEIRMEARILAIADVVESMASHRPYRAALGLNAALEEIEGNRGTLYDAAAADACLRLFREKGFQLETARY